MEAVAGLRPTQRGKMKKAIWILTGLVIGYTAYAMAPDVYRYWKISTM